MADGHARADRRADEAQAHEPGEATQTARTSSPDQDITDPRIFSTVICYCHLLARNNAIELPIISIYVVTLKHYDVATASVLFTILYKSDFRLWPLVAAILIFTDAFALIAFLGCVLILFLKPCDPYTLAVIVSVLIRMFIITVMYIINCVTEILCSFLILET